MYGKNKEICSYKRGEFEKSYEDKQLEKLRHRKHGYMLHTNLPQLNESTPANAALPATLPSSFLLLPVGLAFPVPQLDPQQCLAFTIDIPSAGHPNVPFPCLACLVALSPLARYACQGRAIRCDWVFNGTTYNAAASNNDSIENVSSTKGVGSDGGKVGIVSNRS